MSNLIMTIAQSGDNCTACYNSMHTFWTAPNPRDQSQLPSAGPSLHRSPALSQLNSSLPSL